MRNIATRTLTANSSRELVSMLGPAATVEDSGADVIVEVEL